MTNATKTRKTETFTISNACGGNRRSFRWSAKTGVSASAARWFAGCCPIDAPVVSGPAAAVAMAELLEEYHCSTVKLDAERAAAALEAEAGAHGDLEQVAQCRLALAGDAPSLAAIYAAHAPSDD